MEEKLHCLDGPLTASLRAAAKSETCVYDPQPDITIRELALLLPFFCTMQPNALYFEMLPEEARRHFRRG